jgi:hypothetical protein
LGSTYPSISKNNNSGGDTNKEEKTGNKLKEIMKKTKEITEVNEYMESIKKWQEKFEPACMKKWMNLSL